MEEFGLSVGRLAADEFRHLTSQQVGLQRRNLASKQVVWQRRNSGYIYRPQQARYSVRNLVDVFGEELCSGT